MVFDKIIKSATPPGVAKSIRKLVRRFKNNGRYSGEDPAEIVIPMELTYSDKWSRFRELAQECRFYAEYGSGASTLYMAQNTLAKIRSIETDSLWADRVNQLLPNGDEVRFVDLGPVGKWGRPKTFDKAADFKNYFFAPFKNGYSPDLVLVDGRFRVACFLASMISAKVGAVVVFDDYTYRPLYHIVETLVTPESIGERQGIFIKQPDFPVARAEALLEKFEYVFD